ncbi:MAG: hypothetical protein JW829_02525 [Pirellulales bacterium]|nr:hypothetical protein [Pirellulales bacterium]
MARKIISIKEKRAEAEAAESAQLAKKKLATTGKKPSKRAPRKKKLDETRMKAYWGVFSQSLKRVALYEYADRKKAEKRAKELSESGNKSPHFVQPVKEAVTEE